LSINSEVCSSITFILIYLQYVFCTALDTAGTHQGNPRELETQRCTFRLMNW
jgi:hypothetical protein